MNNLYTNDKSTLILLALLKAHGIHKVIASPGTTNIALMASMQFDKYFQIYSSVDERSAAYIACGLALESGEPVILTCTEATASRNYFPGLTEAYYRKLPILVITGTHGNDIAGHLHAQSLDRSISPKDTVKLSVNINHIKDVNDEWLNLININKAILELKRHGGGPVHINLQEATSAGYDTKQLPSVRKIERITTCNNTFPSMEGFSSVVVFVGSHKNFTQEETEALEKFCQIHNGVVFADHTSGYTGRYKILNALLGCQSNQCLMKNPDLIVHIGEVSGEIYNTYHIFSKQTWRISEDGEIKDLFKNITYIFEMDELSFFQHYSLEGTKKPMLLYEYFNVTRQKLLADFPDVPFGNIWISQQLHKDIPKYSVVHFSIFNSLRSWNFFDLDTSVSSSCNVGGFGIDGAISTLIGASLANPEKLYFGIVGDLAFFYDMNVLGNRHVNSNLRILLVNNGKGTEFRNYDHPASQWGEHADLFMAAAGHFGKKSPCLVKELAKSLGFEYLTASDKTGFLKNKDIFVSTEKRNRPIIFEVFTESEDESKAIYAVRHIVKDERTLGEKVLDKAKRTAKKILKK